MFTFGPGMFMGPAPYVYHVRGPPCAKWLKVLMGGSQLGSISHGRWLMLVAFSVEVDGRGEIESYAWWI